MKIARVRLLLLLLMLTALGLSGGCASLWEDAAMGPYDKAVRDGRMTPAERMRQRDQLSRAAAGGR